MASVTSIYSRALADVVFDRKLDVVKVLQEAQALTALFADSKDLREVWEAPSIPGEQSGVCWTRLLPARVFRAKCVTLSRY